MLLDDILETIYREQDQYEKESTDKETVDQEADQAA
jgi:hypothetical protein